MMAKNLAKILCIFWPWMAIFGPRWPSPGPPGVGFNPLYLGPTRSRPSNPRYRPIRLDVSRTNSIFDIFWTPSDPLLPPQRSKSDLGTIIERSGTKNYLGFIYQTSQTALWIQFYDQIFEYFLIHFWLYHPGDPNHSENYITISYLYFSLISS